MADIAAGQYVKIDRPPASIGERAARWSSG